MKKVLLLTVLLSNFMVFSTVHATGTGPEIINMKTVVMPFPHWKHQVVNGSECFHCHKAEGGKIAGWGKEAAHNLCIPCHDLNDKGPVECKQCHK